MKILVADKLDPRHFDVLDGSGVEIEDRSGISAEDLAEVIGGYEALVVRSRTRVTPELLQRAERLKVVGRAGTGVDNIDVPAATARGVVVMNTPGANSNAAAEHAVAMMAALCRNLAPADAALRRGEWDKGRWAGVELRDRLLAVIGLGRIGQLVAAKARGLGMRVVGHDPAITPEAARQAGVELVDLEEAVGFADVVTLHVPLTEQTRHIVGAKLLSGMKSGVRIVNCARGGLIDETALHEALVSGQVAGAALDVFETEPPTGSPLLELPQVLATPHLGASTVEAQELVSRRILEQVRDLLTGREQRGAVNGVVLDEATRDAVRPFLELARRLGRILGGIQDGVGRLEVRCYGTPVSNNVRALTAYFLEGLLGSWLGEGLNVLNARGLARDRGIEIEETVREEHKSFRTLLSFTLDDGKRRTTVSGTTFGKSNLRLVRIDGYNLDAIPEGWMLLVSNRDVPGIVGHVGTALGEAGVNIANLSLGRDERDGRALAIFNLDSEAPQELVDRLREREGVLGVRLIRVGG